MRTTLNRSERPEMPPGMVRRAGDERKEQVVPITARLLTLSSGARGWIVLGTALTLAVTATYVGQGVAIAVALSRVFDDRPWVSVIPVLLSAFALVGIRAGLLWVKELVSVACGTAVKVSLRRRLYSHLFALGPGYTAQVRSGSVQAVVVDGVEKLEVYFSRFLSQFVGAVVGAALILAGLTAVDPVIGFVLIVASVAIACTPLLVRRAQSQRSSWFWGTWRRLSAEYLDVLQGMTTLKMFDATDRRGQRLSERSWNFYRASIRFVAVANLRTGAMGLVSSGGVAIAVGWVVVRLVSGDLDVFGLLLVLVLAREAFRPLEELQKAYHSAYPAFSAAQGVFGLLDTVPDVPTPRTPLPTPPSGDIVFEGVTFGYDPNRPVLDDLSLRVREGHTVAVVGRSGAGKSTVVALLLRFFAPQHGRITLGGRDVSQVDLSELRSRIAVVSQDTYLFHGTIRSNLLVGRPDATDTQIVDAARAAGIHDMLERLADGYDSVVGERGSTLSGGERQRLAIARALLKDAPILVLDEATSSLDAENEHDIQQALDRLSAGRTTLVIAHRLSTVRDADHLLLLDNGKVTGRGTHLELLRESAGYARLVAAQEQMS